MNLNNIVLIGFMGCGKTSIARALSRRKGYYFIDTDALIESYEGKEIVRIFAQNGEGYFRDLEKLTYTWMKGSLINCVIATGGGFVKSVESLEGLGKIVFIDLSLENVRKRLDMDSGVHRPLADENLSALYESRLPLYESLCDIRIDANDKSLDQIVVEIERSL
ncbi:MAG: shikimate kinase [Campylobacterota bacterium]